MDWMSFAAGVFIGASLALFVAAFLRAAGKGEPSA